MKKIVIELASRMYDFYKGKSLSSGELERYREQAAEGLANLPIDSQRYIIRTGNMLTVAIRDNDDSITVYQAEGYKQYEYRIEEIEA